MTEVKIRVDMHSTTDSGKISSIDFPRADILSGDDMAAVKRGAATWLRSIADMLDGEAEAGQ